MSIDEIFEPSPGGWGLRGDPHMWEDLKTAFRGQEALLKVSEFNLIVEERFQEIIKRDGDEEVFYKEESKQYFQDDSEDGEERYFVPIDNVYFPRYAEHGISGGYISLDWWVEIGLPKLKAIYAELVK